VESSESGIFVYIFIGVLVFKGVSGVGISRSILYNGKCK
jgi:hypothetical protein